MMETATRTQSHAWYRTYLAVHETPTQRYARQLLQGAPCDDASPCSRCGAMSTTPLCFKCAVDDTATQAQKAHGL